MNDIKNYDSFEKIVPINKGLSEDKKYYIETVDGKRLFLRVADTEESDRKRAEFEMMVRVYELGVLTPQPVDFGFCDGGKSVYSLSGWLDGEDVETALSRMSEAGQYRTGLKAGVLLRKIHTLPAPENAELWNMRLRRKVKELIEFCNKHDIKSENTELIINYINNNVLLPESRPQTFCHGDFWAGNLIIAANGEIGIFDYNYHNLAYGDPWSELVDAIVWGKDADSYFLTGLFKGYFGGEPPQEFFKILPYYFACHALSVLRETAQNHGGTLKDGSQHVKNVLHWFDKMNNPVPTWYLKNYDGL